MRTTLFTALIVIHHLVVCGQQSLEKLINDIQLSNAKHEGVDTSSEPLFTFAAPITRTTTLEDLIKIKRSVSHHLHVDLVFLNLRFDSIGLVAIAVQPKKAANYYQTIQIADLTRITDFGIFEVQFQNNIFWYVGFKSGWSGNIETLIATR